MTRYENDYYALQYISHLVVYVCAGLGIVRTIRVVLP